MFELIYSVSILEEKNKIKINIISDNSLVIPDYIIDLQNKSKKTIEKIEFVKKLKNLEEAKNERQVNDFEKSIKKNTFKKKKFYKKKFYKKKVK